MFVLMGIQPPKNFQEYKEECKENDVWSMQTTSSVSPPLEDERNTVRKKNII